MNPRENGLFIKNWANNVAIYHSCGQGSHGKIDPAIPTMHSMIHIIQQIMSIFILLMSKRYISFV